ncbi:MAG TPA: pseudouridine synthase [Patescibacteria group bacterium]|nr:pseudouridine synthase [Patescibacteria group bacterium]
MLIAFHKPYGVLSQFTPDGSQNKTLAEFNFPKGVYPLGRLDADSEGLLLLSDEAGLNTKLLAPEAKHKRTYWAQVERTPTEEALLKLQKGIYINDFKTLPCQVWILHPQPQIPERNPPVRFRKNIETCWIALELVEGKNRQVRKMTASVGYPTLRLLRVKVGAFELGVLKEGEWRDLSDAERKMVFKK